METRRAFLIKGSLSMLAMSLPLTGCAGNTPQPFEPPNKLGKALVVWNSQTGNTKRAGMLIAETLENMGVQVDAQDYRNTDTTTFQKYDLIVAGTPVHYFDVPQNFKAWLDNLPQLNGTPVASYVTFGGVGHNQHNTACRVLERMIEKGGIPIGVEAFGNISMYAITWSTGREARTLNYTHLPNQASCDAIRGYAHKVSKQALSGQSVVIDKEFFALDILKGGPSIWGAKLLVDRHEVNTETCIHCGTCVATCPTGAINPDAGTVESKRCLFCLGCINTCPAEAVEMEYMGKTVYGFPSFARKHNISTPVCR